MPASAQPGFVQGLLQSLQPWMTGANPSSLDNSFQQYGGTQGLLDAMLQGNTPGNLGRGLEGVQAQALQNAAARQGLAQGDINTRLAAMMLPMQRAAFQGAMGSSPGAQPSAQSGS